MSNTRGYLLDEREILNLEEKSLLEKDEHIIFTKDPTTIQDLEEEMDEQYTPRDEPVHFDFSDKK